MSLFEKYIKDKKRLIIATDLEPDDLVSLQLLSKILPEEMKLIFMVGEGDARMKYARMKKYIQLFGFKNTQVLQGCSSDEKFPLDGSDILSDEEIRETRQNRQETPKMCYLALNELFQDKEESVILMLKPLREFFLVFDIDPDTKRFENTILIAYMSFNIKCLFEMTEKKDNVLKFLNSFKMIVYYETFFANGEDNCIESDTDFPFDKLPQCAHSLISTWNDHILKTFKDKLYPTKKQLKIIENIEKNKGVQFVNADCGLIATLLMSLDSNDIYMGTVSFDNNLFSVPSKNPNGKILFIDPKDKKEFKKKQLEIYHNLLD